MMDPAILPMFIGAACGSAAVLCFLILGYRKKLKLGEGSKLGINFSTDLNCPSCGERLPTVRRPKNFRQMMWGGWTCGSCGRECDKWLKPL